MTAVYIFRRCFSTSSATQFKKFKSIPGPKLEDILTYTDYERKSFYTQHASTFLKDIQDINNMFSVTTKKPTTQFLNFMNLSEK